MEIYFRVNTDFSYDISQSLCEIIKVFCAVSSLFSVSPLPCDYIISSFNIFLNKQGANRTKKGVNGIFNHISAEISPNYTSFTQENPAKKIPESVK